MQNGACSCRRWVPLHKAHCELIRVAREHAGRDGEVAVSIFVNRSSLGREAITSGTRARKKPMKNFVETPVSISCSDRAPTEMYADDRSVFVEESSLSKTLEGKSRPGHFRGVCTVVAKLFNILAPDAAVFGEKDFQQLAIVRRMVRDLNFKIDIIAVPTMREGRRAGMQFAQSIFECGRAKAGSGFVTKRLLLRRMAVKNPPETSSLVRGR